MKFLEGVTLESRKKFLRVLIKSCYHRIVSGARDGVLAGYADNAEWYAYRGRRGANVARLFFLQNQRARVVD